jgi:hypothetical protein
LPPGHDAPSEQIRHSLFHPKYPGWHAHACSRYCPVALVVEYAGHCVQVVAPGDAAKKPRGHGVHDIDEASSAYDPAGQGVHEAETVSHV